MPALIRKKIQSMTDKTPNLPLNLSRTSDFQPLNSQRPPQKPGRQHVLHSAAQRAPSSPPRHTADPLPTDPPAAPPRYLLLLRQFLQLMHSGSAWGSAACSPPPCMETAVSTAGSGASEPPALRPEPPALPCPALGRIPAP